MLDLLGNAYKIITKQSIIFKPKQIVLIIMTILLYEE